MAASKKTSEMSPGCGCVFFSVFLLAGLAVTAFFVYRAYLDVRIHTQYQPATCRILNKRLITNSDSDGSTYRPEFEFAYTVDGREYTANGYDGWTVTSSGRAGKEEILAQYQVGGSYPCYYDPANPGRAVLVKRISWLYLFTLIPMIFVAIGAWGIVRSLRQRNLDPVQAEYAERLARAEKEGSALAVLPEITAEPGQSLECRLGSVTREWVQVIVLTCVCLFWNGIVAVFLYQLFAGRVSGGFDWFLALFLIPFVLIGLVLIGVLGRTVLLALGVGETIVEISPGRLGSGAAFEFFVTQSGSLHVNELSVRLVCEEKATYQQGTTTRTDTHKAHEEVLDVRHNFVITHGQPATLRGKASMPRKAMHSFKSKNNEITWKFVVKGDIARWPDFEREFPVLVLPMGKRGPGEEGQA